MIECGFMSAHIQSSPEFTKTFNTADDELLLKDKIVP